MKKPNNKALAAFQAHCERKLKTHYGVLTKVSKKSPNRATMVRVDHPYIGYIVVKTFDDMDSLGSLDPIYLLHCGHDMRTSKLMNAVKTSASTYNIETMNSHYKLKFLKIEENK